MDVKEVLVLGKLRFHVQSFDSVWKSNSVLAHLTARKIIHVVKKCRSLGRWLLSQSFAMRLHEGGKSK